MTFAIQHNFPAVRTPLLCPPHAFAINMVLDNVVCENFRNETVSGDTQAASCGDRLCDNREQLPRSYVICSTPRARAAESF